MKRGWTILFVVLIMYLSGCAPREFHTETSGDANSAYEVEDCVLPTKDGQHIVLENDHTIESYRAHYGLGTCYSLRGNQTVVLFFMDDDESSWSADEIVAFTNERILPALEFLQNQAERWEVELSFTVKRYSTPLSDGLDMVYTGSVIKDLSISGSTKDLPQQVAAIFGFDTELALLAALMEEYETDSVIPLMFINKNGTAYARNQLSEQIVDHMEHAVIFADPLQAPIGSWRYMDRRSATTAHEILYLFGAEDYYLDADRMQLAEKYYIRDVMLLDSFRLSQLNIDKATAYYIGWTDEIPEVCYDENWY